MAISDETLQTLLTNIMTIMTNSSLDETLFEAVLKRLDSFGYAFDETDDGWVLCFAGQSVENKIKNTCNILTIPDGLFNVAVDMVCGEFLFTQQQGGKLDGAFDADEALKSVKVGDATVELGGTGSTTSLDLLIQTLTTGKVDELLCYRKIKW